MSSGINLSVVVPCFNPSKEWLSIVFDNYERISRQIEACELIVVNDGSTKNFSRQLFKEHAQNYPGLKLVWNENNHGKGFALRKGVKAAQGELIIYTDIDFPYTYDSFKKIYSPLQNGSADVVIGIRGDDYYTHLPKVRVRISRLLRWFIIKFLRIPTDDTQCGLKGMNQKGKEVFLQTTINRYLFDLEFIFLAAQRKLSIKTVEVQIKPEVQLTTMSWKILLQEFGNFLKIFTKTFF